MRIFKILRVLVFIALGLVGLYACIGFLGVPWAVKKYGVPEVSKVLGRPVILRDMTFDPFAFNLKLEGFEIQEIDGSPMVGFEQLFVNFEATSVLSEAYRFDIIRLSLPFGLVRILKDGRLNLAELGDQGNTGAPHTSEPAVDPSDVKPLLVDVGLLSIEQGVLEFRDESKSPTFVADIVPLKITLRNFSTRPENQNSYFVVAELEEGERLQWQGNVSLDPLRSQGQLEIASLRLENVWQYVQDQFRFEISDGLLDLQVAYDMDTAKEPVGMVFNEGTITLRNIALREKGQAEELIAVPSFSVRGIEADVGARQVSVDSIQSRGTEVRGWINQDGTVNYQTLFTNQEDPVMPNNAESTPPQTVGSEELPWSATIKRVSLEEYAVQFEDRQPSKPVPLHIKGFGLQLQNVTTDLSKPIALELGFTFNQSGKFAVSGQVTPDPPAGDLKLDLSGFAFAPFQPYLEPFVQFQLVRGALAVNGHSTFTSSESEKAPLVHFSGDVTVDDVALVDPAVSEEFLRWEQLAFQGMDVEAQPTRVSLREIVVALPYAKVVQSGEGTLNLSRLFSPPGSQPSQSEEGGAEKDAESSNDVAEDAKSSPLITIDTVRIQNAAVDFTDEAIDPNVVTGIQTFTGTIQGLSSEELSRADVSLKGRVDDVATLEIQGQVNPLQEDLYTDLALVFQNMDLTTASPYAGKFIGYPITKGKLSLDLDYSLSEKILIGENRVQIDQLTLGDATDSPDAPSLPVPLALALLKDRDGRIDIDLPVRGDLNNPEFSYGQLILQTLVNLITKAATSPFSMLGGLLGDSGDDLSVVPFPVGQATLSDQQIDKLSTLAKALAQRPGLRLEITGGVEPTKDGLTLATVKLDNQLKQLRQQELAALDPTKSSPTADVKLSLADRERLLKKVYVQKFGQELVKGQSLDNVPADSQEENESVSPQQPVTKKKTLSIDEMRQRLLETIQVTEDELRLLAQERARSIRDQLVNKEQISEERIFLVEANLAYESEGETVRTNLTLTAQ